MRARLGMKLNSAVSSAQLIVVRAPGEDIDLRCAGEPMIVGDPAIAEGEADEDALLLGKRYSDEAGTLELLCTKSGRGPLSVGETRLTIKAAKALPASD